MAEILLVLLLPFMGTVVGAGTIFFIKKDVSENVNRGLIGAAAGIMTYATFFSLIVPSLELTEAMGTWAFLPCAISIIVGALFLYALDKTIPHMHINTKEREGRKSSVSQSLLLILAITLHSIPEGLAVGSNLSAWMTTPELITFSSALVLSIAMALHNIPETAVVAIPLHVKGLSKWKAFFYAIGTGAVEPVFAVLALFLGSLIAPYLAWALGFAAGAMLYVVIEDLVPQMTCGVHSHTGVLCFIFGFVFMLVMESVIAV